MKIYHGTTEENWMKIREEGLRSGFFASDKAFALTWRGIDTVVIETELSPKVRDRGLRIKKGLTCRQFEVREGELILPVDLRLVPAEELEGERDYLRRMGV